MTTLTATARDDIPAVLLEVASAPAGAVTITRTDANGDREVRLLPGQEPISGSMVVYDYEAALAGEVVYVVTDSAAGTATDTVTTAAAFPHLHTAVLPHNGTDLSAVLDYQSGREATGTVHWPILRSTPVTVSGPMRYRSGSLTVWAGSFEDARIVEGAASSGEVCMLRQPTFAGMDMYFMASRVSIQPRPDDTSPRRWEVTIDWQETGVPSGSLLSAAAWSYADAAEVGTYAELAAAFPTYHELAVGP